MNAQLIILLSYKWRPLLVWAILNGFVLYSAGCEHHSSERNVKLSTTHYLLGDDYLKRKLPDAAKKELLTALELNPENKDAHQLLGIIFFMEGVQKQNILNREQCLKGRAADEELAEINKEFRRSEAYLTNAIKIAEKNNTIESDTLNYLANIALHFKRYDEAVALSKRALENIIYSARHILLGTLGWAYYQKGDRISAARELRQAIFQEPKFCIGRYRLAKVYFEDKDYNSAIKELKTIVDDNLCPIQEAFQLLGLLYLKQHNAELAREQFDKCLSFNVNSCIAEECRRYNKSI